MAALRFDGRVALITGAGGGLGREYALMLASRGASVVVNDLGGSTSGSGKSSKAADETVSMIRSRGGKAVPDYNSVEDGDKVVKTAIDTFGRIDILINNAGILRDRSFARISNDDWDMVHKVHLRGSFLVTRAAWPYMKKQNYGRVIMTASPSGIYGNFGQANYSAAKLGLVGLNNTLAIEGQKYNICCNTVAPTAYSRMTKDLLPPEAKDLLKAEYIAPVVVYLCHESCEDTGGLFETLGGWAGKVRLQKSGGKVLRKANQPFTPEDVRDDWSAVCDMSRPMYHKSLAEVNAAAFEALQSIKEEVERPVGSSGEGLESAIGLVKVQPPFKVTHREIILYALGVGCELTRTNKSDLKYLYELHSDFAALPTFGVIPPFVSPPVALCECCHGQHVLMSQDDVMYFPNCSDFF
jgi:3-hydroxyacyl-CoA dehydrogenase/3a,7a,12a-trihydroxy-5b-cholest-24-enoyl-CoA hydratase